MEKADFIIQAIDAEITSNETHVLKDSLDQDYSHLVGISISNVFCSEKAILEQVKVKGIDVLPEDFEAIHLMTSSSVEPNKRFFSWFSPVDISGDDIVIKFKDSEYADSYKFQVNLLLANNPKEVLDVLFT